MGKGQNIISQIKYPKLILLIFTFIIAYQLFYYKDTNQISTFVQSWGYFGSFLAGVLFTYGFTAAPAVAILLILAKSQNILFAGLIAGFGSLLGDLIIFRFIRSSLQDELNKLSEESIIIRIKENIPLKVKDYLLPVIGGIIIASPLPDELGVAILAASRNVSTKIFMTLSYFLNTAGILIILFIGNSI